MRAIGFGLLLLFSLSACGGADTAESAPELALQGKADAYVQACLKQLDYGSNMTPEECQCIADAVVEYIPAERAGKFFDDITALYAIEDAKRRDDNVDRFFRDLIIGLAPEERPQWNAMMTEVFPICRSFSEGADE